MSVVRKPTVIVLTISPPFVPFQELSPSQESLEISNDAKRGVLILALVWQLVAVQRRGKVRPKANACMRTALCVITHQLLQNVRTLSPPAGKAWTVLAQT